jgi:hypothetical protein
MQEPTKLAARGPVAHRDDQDDEEQAEPAVRGEFEHFCAFAAERILFGIGQLHTAISETKDTMTNLRPMLSRKRKPDKSWPAPVPQKGLRMLDKLAYDVPGR